ncbi:hypothetical protein DFH09DRAFT_1340715 [Mycena vulgaris]|nr:hypothetical protein DFH09DRAFT_1340715 [Mycena vulgaris]
MHHHPDDIRLITAHRPFLLLKTLKIIGSAGEEKEDYTTTGATMDILRACPNLIECTVDQVDYHQDQYGNRPTEVVVFPLMQHLKFGTSPDVYSSERILHYISMPRPQTLYCPLSDLEFQDVLQFLKRSSPPLQKIVLGFDSMEGDWAYQEIKECLYLLPELTHVELIGPTNTAADHFVTILANSPHLVPKLTNLSCRWFAPSMLWDQKLAKALLIRRKQIEFVQVESTIPAENLCVALRQLAADGMTIQIGTRPKRY